MPIEGGNNDYENEEYDPNLQNAEQPEDGGDNNENVPAEGGEDVDQYFDDAGDIGYLPADHVNILNLTRNIATDAETAERVDEAAD